MAAQDLAADAGLVAGTLVGLSGATVAGCGPVLARRGVQLLSASAAGGTGQ